MDETQSAVVNFKATDAASSRVWRGKSDTQLVFNLDLSALAILLRIIYLSTVHSFNLRPKDKVPLSCRLLDHLVFSRVEPPSHKRQRAIATHHSTLAGLHFSPKPQTTKLDKMAADGGRRTS